MTLRSLLYALLWLSFAQTALGLPPFSATYVVDAHAAVGVAVLALAHTNFAKLRRSGAPARLKRIARATAILATVQVVLGIVLFLAIRLGVALDATATAAISFVHLVIALGILAEAASVATAHDMWEKREYAAPAS